MVKVTLTSCALPCLIVALMTYTGLTAAYMSPHQGLMTNCPDDENGVATLPKYTDDLTRVYGGQTPAKKRMCTPPSCFSSPCQPHDECVETRHGFICEPRISDQTGRARDDSTSVVRLSGGESRYEGRVELLHEGTWRSISVHSWDIYDAFVVCRSLGFPALLSTDCAVDERASSKSHHLHLHCDGDENDVTDCDIKDYNLEEKVKAASVECGEDTLCGSNPCVHGECHPQPVYRSFSCSCRPGFTGRTCRMPIVQSCKELSYLDFTTSGVYTINPGQLEPFDVVCDMEDDGGGWTVFQRRFDGGVSFDRNWGEYEEGFGSILGEHWLGLSKIHRIASTGVELKMSVTAWDDHSTYTYTNEFTVDNNTNKYQASFSSPHGTLYRDHLNITVMKRSAEHIPFSLQSCGTGGEPLIGWWWDIDISANPCLTNSNLNGHYGEFCSLLSTEHCALLLETKSNGKLSYRKLKTTEMKIRG